MKRFLLFAVAVLAFVGCNEMFEDKGNSNLALSELPTLTAGFEEYTRTYVESNKYLRWHEGDLISVFVGNTQNCQYRFLGATGANSGEFEPVESDNLGTGNALERIYAVYPYDAEATISDLGVISYSMPATQTYAEESFGRGANVMVAATESLDDRYLGFKNACGYLKIKLHGGGVVTSIKLKGNNGEKIAGNATITATYGGVPEIVMLDDATDSIILDCGDGVELSTDAENPTEFWIVVPPIEFSKGITIVAYSDKTDYEFTKSTDSPITIERNVVQPMKSLRAEFLGHTGNDHNPSQIPNDEIWYTSTDGNIVEPYVTDVFGANIVSNAYDDGKGVITFDGAVTTIGNWAFYDCTSLTSVTIPDSVTTIGVGAFARCYGLNTFYGKYASDDGRCLIKDNTIIAYAEASGTEYTIPDSVTTIGGSAFYYCKSLTSVTIPDSVTTIGDSAFSYCKSLTSVTIGDSVTTIGDHAFSGCDSLTSITIPDSVTTIGDWAFYSCNSLTSVTIPDSVTTIGDYAFGDCYSLTSITIPNSVTTIGDHTFYSCESLTSITIPDSVTTIGDYAFAHCDSLTSITIPDSVTTIEKGAFARCGFTSITIPDSVTTIGERAFENCDSLTSVTIPDSVTTIEGMAFYDCDSLTSVTIGDSVTTIGETAFSDCDSLTSVTIGDSVTTIGDSAFCDCSSLTSVTIGDSVTTIGDHAFDYCKSLTSLTIPDSVTTIGDYAFIWCVSLTSVTIPDSVTTIGTGAFFFCSSLTSVYCKATTPPTMGVGGFERTSLEAIYVPAASVDAYKTAGGWCDYADYIVG